VIARKSCNSKIRARFVSDRTRRVIYVILEAPRIT
jgi:hypothetical protein